MGLEYKLTLKDYFKKTMLGAIDSTKKLDDSVNKVHKSLKTAGAAIVGFFAFDKIKDFGLSIVESLKNYEYFSASLRTLMYGDRNAAKSLEGQLIKLAATTPFSLVDVQEGSKQLLAYGFRAGNVTKDLKMLGDVASGVGAPLTDIVYLYGTLKTQGRAYTRDIMQFTSRGIPIIGQLAKQFGVTESKIKGMVEEGKVGFPEVERAFKTMTGAGGQFFGMMDEQSRTVGGRLSNLGDAWEQLKVSIGKSQTGIISTTVNWANSLVSSVQSVIEKLNQMDEAFAASGKNLNYTMMERFNNWLFMGSTSGFANMFTGGKGKMDMLQRSLESMYVNPSRKDELSALSSKKLLAQFASNYIGAFQKKEIGQLEYDRGMALIKYAQKQIEGNLTLFKTAGVVKNKEEKAKNQIGSPTEWNQPRQNVYITVDTLGRIDKIEIANMNSKDFAGELKSMHADWAKELLEVVNDANLIARR